MVFDLGMPDRIALITGASRGIGLAIAHRLSADGYHVVVTARSADKIADLADQLKAAGRPADAVACDLGDRSSVDDLVAEVRARHGRLDVLVNNAGALPAARVAEDVTRAEWDAVLEVNLSAPWFLACRAKELMGDHVNSRWFNTIAWLTTVVVKPCELPLHARRPAIGLPRSLLIVRL